jgi:hypothetical protein
MGWIFIAFFASSVLHMIEEYFFPGGFMAIMKRFNPKFAPLVTVPMAVIINGLQLVLCVMAIAVWKNALIFGMSVAGLLFINGLAHIAGCFRIKGYAPGVVTGVLFYIPLSVYAYAYFSNSGQLTRKGLLISIVLGLLYQAVPIVYLGMGGLRKRALTK